MNERIKLLALEAGMRTTHLHYGRKDPYVLWEDDIKKFAELIVEECAGLFVDQKYMILNPLEPFANERIRALKEHDKDTVRKIKGHFGVEE
jgi:hypothetical protein